jgi:molybdenum cofactor guanylyltransferase
MASAAILVGGRARRFGGRDKSALVVGGRTILERQLAALAPLTDDVLLVGSAADVGSATNAGSAFGPSDGPAKAGPHRYSEGAHGYIDGAHRYVEDRVAESGPLGGLDAALAAARDDAVILLACDMPFVTTAWLAYLLASADGFEAVVPRSDRGYHPLCAVYTRACQATVSERLAERMLAMGGLLETVRTRVIEPEDVERFGPGRRLLANVNTPGEFDELEALLGHKL